MKGFSIALSVVISGSFVGDAGALGVVVAGVTTPNDVGGDEVRDNDRYCSHCGEKL